MNLTQNSSSLICYGNTYLNSRKGKIKVQPSAVSRSNFKNGSRQKQDTSRKRRLELFNRRATPKRELNFANIVKFDKLSAKKSDPTMSSTTTYLTRKERVLPTDTAKTDKETDK